MASLQLLPVPKQLQPGTGQWKVPAEAWIVLPPTAAPSGEGDPFFLGQYLLDGLGATTQAHWKLARGPALDAAREVRLRYDAAVPHEQGYRLRISPEGVELVARTAAGLFYGIQTLIQIARQTGDRWPAVAIDDQPDFPRRGVYHDVSRGKVPTVETILSLVDELAHLKINEFQLYIENVYEFRRHPAMYSDTTPLTSEELMMIDRYCRQRFIDFVPSLTSLGHFEKILKRPEYRHLAEAEASELRARGHEAWSDDPWGLCVTDPGSKQLLKEMYDEFASNFSSTIFNVCCDESYDLGKVRSKELADKVGVQQLYVDWIKYCDELALANGKQKIQMWGDIILHHPEFIPQLPENVILLEWGYEATHAFAEHAALFAKSGKPFYVCPGTSTWLSLAGRTANSFANLRMAAQVGKQHGAIGYLNTDWGDNGHQQFLAVSLLPFAFGAAMAWGEAENSDEAVLRGTNAHVFLDPKGKFAQIVADLGNTFQRIGFQRFNGSTDWFLLRETWDTFNYVKQCPAAALKKTLAVTEKLKAKIEQTELNRIDSDLILAEFRVTADEIIHACRRSLVRQALAKNPKAAERKELAPLAKDAGRLASVFSELWLARNKPSRLQDVLDQFTRLQTEYAAAKK